MKAAVERGTALRFVNAERGESAPVLRRGNGRRVLREDEVQSSPEVSDFERPSRGATNVASQVRSENRAATGLDPRDGRWVLAVRAAQSIEGGQAAIMSPEKRRRLIAMGVGLGLRPFDTSLVIAIVQDSARSGLPALGRMTEERLSLVNGAAGARSHRSPSSLPLALLLTSLALAACIFAALFEWIA
jgi:hypothetical protein